MDIGTDKVLVTALKMLLFNHFSISSEHSSALILTVAFVYSRSFLTALVFLAFRTSRFTGLTELSEDFLSS